MDKWNGVEDPNINTHTYGHLILDKETKIIQWEKESVFTNCAGITECQHVEEWK